MNIIIDGSNLLHRSFWVAEKNANNHNTLESDVLFIFLKSIKGLVQKFNPDNVWVAWDKRLTHNSTNFRKKLIPDKYKATRDGERNAKVISNHECIEKALQTLGIKQMYPNVLEADDIISWLTQKINTNLTIISVDKDLLQLVSKKVNVYNPIKKVIINVLNFTEIVGVDVDHFVKFKALMGDVSDNIEGVEGFGIQRSKKLCVESVYDIERALSEDKGSIFLKNIKLMDLKDSVTHESGEAECYQKQFNTQLNTVSRFKDFEDICNIYNFQSFIKDIKTWKRYFHTERNLSDLILKLSHL